jgi:putative tryptophan/tyrosine transport system substrate-binding protein
MNRREFITSLGGAVGVTVWSRAGRGQVQGDRPLIVWLGSGTTAAVGRWLGFLRKGLEELGYTDGRNIEIVVRMAENRAERLPGLAQEIVALKPAVIVAGAVDSALALKKTTSTIPIVSGALADADHLGLIANYSRPGGNVTGITPYIAGLPAKQIELARELVPSAAKIGLLGNVNDPKAPPQRDELKEAARALGLATVIPEVSGAEGLAEAIQGLASERVDVAIVLQTTMLLSMRKEIAPLMATNRLPAVYGYREHVDEGGLISYGVNLGWCWQQLATHVHKILKGASPADLPVEFPPRLQMVVNMKTANALGITIPPILLARADEVIE